MSALHLKTIDALCADAHVIAAKLSVWAETAKVRCVAMNKPIYSSVFLATTAKQFSAMLAKHQDTITEANVEIDRLKSENEAKKDRCLLLQKVANRLSAVASMEQAKAEVIDVSDSDSDSDSDVIEVNRVVYNGVTYHREVNSNVLYHPKRHEVVGMWNDGRGRVDVLPINPHED